MMAAISYVIDLYNSGVMEKIDPRTSHLPLMSSPFPTLLIIAVYFYFVYNLGPALMRKRKPMDVKKPMILYNIVQIIVNSLFVFEYFRFVLIPGRQGLTCGSIDYSGGPLTRWDTFYSWLYFMVKIIDLSDTVFMVLRKKQSQISFLHVYHHSGMVVVSWLGTRFVPGGYSLFFGTVNAFVHVLMYSYYLITALYPQYKNNIWLKKNITLLQMVQFTTIIVYGCINFFNPYCNFPKIVLGLFLPQNMFMLFLFWDFYKKAYLTAKKK